MADVPLVKSPVPLVELDGADVATGGQVPTADGSGGVAWETPSGGVSGAWTSYTSAWTGSSSNPAIGNGTIEAAYRLDGKTLHLRIRILFGSTTTYGSGYWVFGLPSGLSAAANQVVPGWIQRAAMRIPIVGNAQGATIVRTGFTRINTTTGLPHSTSDSTISNNNPWAWAAGDEVLFTGTIEVA